RHPRYRVLETLGEGGFGTVFRAEHLLMGRMVALKLLRGELLRRPDAVERFCREVRALAGLSHPNILTIHDAEQAGGSLFYTMEFVEGESLDRVLRRCGRVPVGLSINWVRQV